MKNLNRILSLLLTLLLCFGAVGIVSSANEVESTNSVTSQMDILRELGIIPDYYDYNTNFDEEVSRADFADAVAKLINIGQYQGTEAYYYDVLKSHYAYNSISMLTEMGIINGTGEKIFEPDLPIEDAAAYKIILSVMGYGEMAYYNGGYPQGYLKFARQTEIYEASQTDNMTRGEMLGLLYRAMQTPMLEMKGISADGTIDVLRSDDGETILSLYHDIYIDTGILYGARGISLNEKRLEDEREIIIGDEVYLTDNDMTEYLGAELRFFWYDDEKNDKKEFRWIDREDKRDILDIEVNGDASFDGNSFEFKYMEGDKLRTLALSRGLNLICNGRVVENNFGEILNKRKYTARFIKTDGVYKTAVVRAYENFVADSVDSLNSVIYDAKSTEPLEVSKNLYEYLSIRNEEGNKIAVQEITSGSVLSVFRSVDKTYLDIIVSIGQRSGVVESISNDSGNYKIKISDEVYYMSQDAYNANFVKFKVGDSVTLFMDYTGEVEYVTAQVSSLVAAYVIDVAIEDNTFNKKIKIKALKQDGTVATMECAEKLSVNGIQDNNADVVASLFKENGKTKGQLVLLELSTDGFIRNIDTAMVGVPSNMRESDSLYMSASGENQTYKPQGTFGAKAVMNGSTVIFQVPVSEESVENEKRYRVIAKSELKDAVGYNIEAYNTVERAGCAEYVVIKTDSYLDDGDVNTVLPVLITAVGDGVNADGEIVESITGFQGTIEKTFVADGNFEFSSLGIKEGMLVRLHTTPENEIGGVEIIFNPESDTFETPAVVYKRYMWHCGYVNDIVDNVIKFGFKTGADVDYTMLKGNAPVLVYDSSMRNKAYVGSFADAVRYCNVKNDSECSKVVVISRYLAPSLYVIYNS